MMSFSSMVIRRVCRSTMAAEKYALQASAVEAIRIRAAITDTQGKLNFRNWEASSAEHLRMDWLVDCQSLVDHLKNPTLRKCSDKRLSIELAALRHPLWQLPDSSMVDELCDGFRDQSGSTLRA